MNPLKFEFNVNKENKTVEVIRQFDAELPLVWDAWTKQEILDLWWAPAPWKAKTKIMNFEKEGYRLYAMVGPQGEEHWSKEKYTAIQPKTYFQMSSYFTDQEGNINNDFPTSLWDVHFSEQNGITEVKILIHHNSVADIEKLITMGFKEGFTMGLNQLEKLLPTLM